MRRVLSGDGIAIFAQQMEECANGCEESYAAGEPEPPPMPLEEARHKFPPIWVVYDHPTDFPDRFVSRLCFGLTAAPDLLQADTLEELRAMIRRTGCAERIERSVCDDPCIVECWL